jgi:hypothetical protein
MKTTIKSAKATATKVIDSLVKAIFTLKHNGKIRRSDLFFENPKNGNLVCYQRAQQLHLLSDKRVKTGFKNPKTGMLITKYRAQALGLIKSAA